MAAPYPSFPASPTIGQTYTDANGAVWTFGNIGWTKTLVSLTSDPSIWQDIDSALSYDSSGNVTITGGLTAGGKVSIPLGTAPLPSLYFGTDTNTGIYSPGADQVGIATNGTSRLVVDASGNLGLGVVPKTWTLSGILEGAYGSFGATTSFGMTIAGNAYYNGAWKYKATSTSTLQLQDSTGFKWYTAGVGTQDTDITFTQAMTLDASGRLLVGTSSAPAGSVALAQVQGYVGNATGVGVIEIKRGLTVPAGTDEIGRIDFSSSNSEPGGRISVFRDGGTWTTGSSYPGRLVFSTTADGAASPTERMSIGNAGVINTYTATGDSLNIRNAAAAGTATGLIYGLYSATSTSNGTVSFTVWSNGNVVNTSNSYGPISSDQRLKQDITDANSQWDDIKNIRITNFHYKNDPAGPLHLGPIAQELEQVSPGLITRRPAFEDEIADPSNSLVDGDEVLSFKASILYMKAVKALQEAMERIETLETKVAALESR